MDSCRAIIEQVYRRCGLARAVGGSERCPGARCPFWEADGSLGASGRCSIDEVVPYLRTLPELANHLLELRADLRGLEAAREPLSPRLR